MKLFLLCILLAASKFPPTLSDSILIVYQPCVVFFIDIGASTTEIANRMKRWNTKTGKTKQNRDIHRQRLPLCGDIELNPGPVTNYKNITNVFSHYKKKLKFFHVNCQSMVKKTTSGNHHPRSWKQLYIWIHRNLVTLMTKNYGNYTMIDSKLSVLIVCRSERNAEAG